MPLSIIQSKAESCRCPVCGTRLTCDEWNDIICTECDEEEEIAYFMEEEA